MVSVGSIFVDLGARLVREGFEGFNREVTGAQRYKEHYIRLGGKLDRLGFNEFRKLVADSGADTQRFAAVSKESFGVADTAMADLAAAASRYLGVVKTELSGLDRAYAFAARAAEESAARQRAAMESAVPTAHAMEAKGAAAGRAASGGFNKEFRKAADVGKVGALGAAVVGGVSVKWSTDFQKNMELLRTEAGYSQKQVNALSKEVLNLAPAVGQSPNKLAEGLYHIASAGIPAHKAMADLRVAADGARIGNANLQDVTKQMAAVMESSPHDIHSASEAMGVLVRIVGHGNLRMRDLIAAMGSGVLPTAVNLGLGLRDVGAALDTLSARGIPAEQGATRLRTSLQLMADPSHKASGALAKIGLDTEAVAKAFHSPGGLVAGLQLVKDHLNKTFPPGGHLTTEQYKNAIADYNKQLDAMGARGRSREQEMNDFKKRLKEVGASAIEQNKTLVDAFGGARMGSTMITLMQHIDDVRTRIRGIGPDSTSAVKEYHAAVAAYQKTAAFQFQQFWAEVQKLGIQIGNFILPAVLELVHALEDVGHFLGRNRVLADALATVFAIGLTIAIGAWVLKVATGFKNSAKSLYDFTTQLGGLRGKFGGTATAAEESSKAQITAIDAVTGAIDTQTEALQVLAAAYEKQAAVAEASQAGVARTTMMPGAGFGAGGGMMAAEGEAAAMTPGAAALEAWNRPTMISGESTLGRSTKLEMARRAGAARREAIIMARKEQEAVAHEVAQAEAAVLAEQEASMTTTLEGEAGGVAAGGRGRLGGAKGLLKKLGGRAGSGLMIGLGGTLASQMAGGLIGGKAGGDVSSIGTGVATGAGIGMLLGPEGALAGGAIGGIVAGFSHFLGGNKAEEFGKKTAKQFEHGMGMLHLNISAPTAAHTQKVIEDTSKKIKEAEDKAQPHLRGGRGRGAAVAPAVVPGGLTPEERRKIQEEYDKMGRAAAQAFNEGMKNGPKYQTVGTMLGSFRIALNSLPTQARKSAADSMLKMSATMEQEGRLPKGATNQLVRDLVKSYGYLSPQLKDMTHDAMKDIETEIQQGKAVDRTQQMVDQIGHTFADAPKVGKVNAHNVRKVWEEEMGFLKDHMHTGTVGMQEDAASLWSQMHSEAHKSARLMRMDVDKELGIMEGAFTSMASGIGTAMDSTVTSVADAHNEIAHNLNKLSKDLGGNIHIADSPRARQKQSNVFGSKLPSASTLLDAPGAVGSKATGGMVSAFGGGAADDHILVDPHGNPVAKMSATEGVINRPQMGIVDMALGISNALGMQPYPSLGHLWGSGMRHYAGGGLLARATGGYVDPMGKSLQLGRTDMGVDFAGAGPVAVIGDALFTRVSPQGSNTGWPGATGGRSGAMIVYQLLGGPKKGSYVYLAENVDPVGGLHTGSRLKAGRVFAHARGSYPFLETGWAADASGRTTASATTGYHEGEQTQAGKQFLNFLGSLGVSGAGNAGGPTGGGSLFEDIHDPEIVGRGALASIARSATRQMTHSANHYLHKLADASGSGSPGTPEQARKWTQLAMRLAGVSGGLWEKMLLRQEGNESSYDPRSRNLTAAGVAAGYPEGMMNVTRGTFQRYKLPGHGNTFNPVDNIAAAIKYIIAQYGKGDAARGAQVMWARGGGAYALGGLLRRFQRGGSLHPRAHAATATHAPHLGVVPHSSGAHVQHTLHPAAKKKLPIARAHSGPQVLPHSLGNLSKFTDLPGIGPIDDADTAIKEVDSKYSAANRYFSIVDAQLTPDDLGQLIGLRTQQGTLLQQELGLEDTAGANLNVLATTNDESLRIVKTQAQSVLGRLNQLKAKLKREGQRLATMRHTRAGHMLDIADKLAKRIKANADHRAKLAAHERQVRHSYEERIAHVMKAKPKDVTDALNAVDHKYAGTISYHQKYSPSKIPGIRRQIKAEKDALRRGHRSAMDAHSGQVRALIDARRKAIYPIENQRAHLVDNARHISEDEAAQRRKYQRKGWNDVWAATRDKWKLQSDIDALRQQEKDLTGSTTEIGTGGLLGKLVQHGADISTAQDTVKGRIATTQQDILSTALDDLDLAGQRAQATADTTKKETDLADFLPPGVTDILTRSPDAVPPGVGVSVDDIHRKYEPSDTAAGGGAPSPADVAAAAMAQLATLEASSRQLYAQFGSNTVGASGSALQAALSGAPFGGGVRFFGAAGPGINAGLGMTATGTQLPQGEDQGGSVENNFYQTNHYSSGPEDPHIHAQASRAQFQTAFG